MRQPCEVSMVRNEGVGAKAGRAKPCRCARQLDWIDVKADHASAGQHPFEDGFCMTAAAERAVHRDVASAGAKTGQDLGHHDRSMRARRRLAGREHLLHLVSVPGGVAFFVLLVERPWMRAGVSRPAHMHRSRVRWCLHQEGSLSSSSLPMSFRAGGCIARTCLSFRLSHRRGISPGHGETTGRGRSWHATTTPDQLCPTSG